MEFNQQDVFLGQSKSSSEKITQYQACLDEFSTLGYDDPYLQEIRLEMSIMLKRQAVE
ncbi:hypothetical protein KO527_24310 [Pseudoalteromonas sp. C2R02]|uniref:hypothetical protein n=1 Tax=Pseudoalteromonas sp. C2R02 TaxID=2841565 RepID=UPI001C08C92B|nr:hypothetical protein [Pseudoalteromonas sp. C2R02]MBU2972463.1 hypothetical protein [Pseudoalteromonas sp. C2R02]